MKSQQLALGELHWVEEFAAYRRTQSSQVSYRDALLVQVLPLESSLRKCLCEWEIQHDNSRFSASPATFILLWKEPYTPYRPLSWLGCFTVLTFPWVACCDHYVELVYPTSYIARCDEGPRNILSKSYCIILPVLLFLVTFTNKSVLRLIARMCLELNNYEVKKFWRKVCERETIFCPLKRYQLVNKTG